MPVQIATIWDSFLSSLTTFMNFIPTLVGAFIILAIGWILSNVIAKLIARVLVSLKLDHVTAKTDLDRFLVGPNGHFHASYGVAFLAKWFIRLVFLQAAANLLSMPQVTGIINSMLLFIPNIAVALLIIIVGSYFARFLSGIVQGAMSKTKVSRPDIFSIITRYAVMGFAIIAALNHLGIAVVVVNTLFVGFVASLSLALGLAFGLGGQGVASEVTRNWYDQSRTDRLTAIPGGQTSSVKPTVLPETGRDTGRDTGRKSS